MEQKMPVEFDFNLFDQDNEIVHLKSYLGQRVVLYFYPKDNTPGCTKQAIAFSEQKAEFDRLNTVVLGVSKDSVKSHKNFCTKYNLTHKLISDPDILLQKEFDVWREKSMYGKIYFGTQRSTFVISVTGEIEKVWRNVKVKGHIENVLNYLKGSPSC